MSEGVIFRCAKSGQRGPSLAGRLSHHILRPHRHRRWTPLVTLPMGLFLPTKALRFAFEVGWWLPQLFLQRRHYQSSQSCTKGISLTSALGRSSEYRCHVIDIDSSVLDSVDPKGNVSRNALDVFLMNARL